MGQGLLQPADGLFRGEAIPVVLRRIRIKLSHGIKIEQTGNLTLGVRAARLGSLSQEVQGVPGVSKPLLLPEELIQVPGGLSAAAPEGV